MTSGKDHRDRWDRSEAVDHYRWSSVGEEIRETEDLPSHQLPNFVGEVDASHFAGQMGYTDGHPAEMVAMEVGTDFAAAAAEEEGTDG
jgi:hypothetical protein